MWLTRDDVTRGTTLFQSPYNSALFYVYSICYTNIQLSASARQMLFIGRLPYWNFQKVRVKCSQPVTLHLCFTTSSVLTYVHCLQSKILLHKYIHLSTTWFSWQFWKSDFLDSFEKFPLPFKTERLTSKSKFQCKSKFHRDLNFVDLTRDFWTKSLVFCYN